MAKRNHACDRYIGKRRADGTVEPFISASPDRRGKPYLVYIDDAGLVWCRYEDGTQRASQVNVMEAMRHCRNLTWGDAQFSLWERFAPCPSPSDGCCDDRNSG